MVRDAAQDSPRISLMSKFWMVPASSRSCLVCDMNAIEPERQLTIVRAGWSVVIPQTSTVQQYEVLLKCSCF